jgi:transcriptional regulator with XRE-family HTH domain
MRVMKTIDQEVAVEPKDAIKNLRTKLNESQAEFARRFSLAQRSISHYELGLGYPRPIIARRLAQLAFEQGLPYDFGCFLPR